MTTTSRTIHALDEIEPRAGLPFREFVSMINSDEIFRSAGRGLTVADVVAHHQDAYRDGVEEHMELNPDHDPRELLSDADHIAVWQHGRLLAVLIPEPNGEPRYVVTTFADGKPVPAE